MWVQLALSSLALVGLPQELPFGGFRIPPERMGATEPIDLLVARTAFADEADPERSRHARGDLEDKLANLDRFLRFQSYGNTSIGRVDFAPLMVLEASSEYAVEVVETATGEQRRSKRSIPSDVRERLRASTGRDPLTEYDSLFIYTNAPPAGVDLKQGSNGRSVLDGRGVLFLSARPTLRLAAHELGHNLGLPHARATLSRSGTQVVPAWADQWDNEYGDPFSPMGRGNWAYSVVEKARKGWIGLDPRGPRWIAPLTSGQHALSAHDHPDASGLVGLFMRLDLGITMREAPLPDARPTPNPAQTVWLSILSRGPWNGTTAPPSGDPRLLLHVSCINGPKSAVGRHTLLDTRPGSFPQTLGHRRWREDIEDTGLRVGESITLRAGNGTTLQVRFVAFDAESEVGQVEVDRADP